MGKRIVYFNGHITTLDPTCPRAEAVAVEDGRIVAVGDNEQILLDFGRADAVRVDLCGGYALPGLVDSHIHLSGVGQQLGMVDLGAVRSVEEMLAVLRERAGRLEPGEWLIGMGWDENRLGRMPSLEELDRAVPDHPLFLSRVCFHTFLVNSRAYRAAGIREDEPDPERGSFGRDEHGALNGLVYENASRLFVEAQPKPGYRTKKETMRRAMRLALASGLTGVHTEDLRYIGSVDELIRICRELREEGVLLRTHHLIYHPHLHELDELGWRAGQGDEWFRIGAMKMFADGSIGGRTALLSRAYADDPGNTGMGIHDPEELLYLTGLAADRLMPVAVHAIGDEAADRVITAMEAHPFDPDKGVNLRHRLIHAQIMRPDLIERLARLPVAVDIQPRFVASDFPWVLERIDPELARCAYAWKTLLAAGIRCAGGSDAPIEPLHPLLGIHAAITRRRLDDPDDHPGHHPHETLNRLEAVQLFTSGSAYAAGEEHERGTLSVGKRADLTVYDRDIFAVEIDELLEARTLFTVVNGETAYRVDE
ncbi:amidohydrolase [Staphylospora marina]|uniref:amidohydrolase n=1 Tax=Staphylospora marina TaxID=2490858 RepID=UPI000F5BBB44|nr:amidohydrolase [Staphylospora marina]